MVDLDKLMQGIRGEIRANRKEDGKRHLAVVSVPGNGHLAYSVKELLKLSDVDFVRGAYLTLLGREVDPTGLSSNLESLRIGRSDRLSVLHALSQSEEARRYAAPVVLPPLPPRRPLRNRLDPRKLIQRFFGIRQLVKTGDQLKADLKRRLMGAEAAVGDLGNLNGAQTTLQSRLDDRLGGTEAAVKDLGNLRGAQSALQSRLDDIANRLVGTEAAVKNLGNLQGAQSALQSRLDDIANRLVGTEAAVEDLGYMNGALTALQSRLDDIASRLVGTEAAVKDLGYLKGAETALHSRLDDFANRLVGTEAAVKDLGKLQGAETALQSRLDDFANRLVGTEATVKDLGKLQGAETALQSRLDDFANRLMGTEATVKNLGNLQGAQTALELKLDNITVRLANIACDAKTLFDEFAQVENSIVEHGRLLPEIRTELTQLQFKIVDHWRYIADQARRLDILITEARRRLPDALDTEQLRTFSNEGEKQLNALYVTFEDRYRGTREDIMQRQSCYLPYAREAAEATGGAPFVDIGCGRGEFLELLRANGLTIRGIDLNSVMIAECRQRGLEAVEGDALNFLRGLPPASLAGVSGFHIIEHVPFGVLIDLFDEVLRVLAPGGVAIFETPNPANLLVAAERFYIDPTHRSPLPSEMVSFMAESRGFVRVNVLPLHPVPAQRRDYDDPMLILLQDKFYGPQDYGLIAWKAK